MGDDLRVHLQMGFPLAWRAQAARLYDGAFGAKLGLAVPDAARRQALLADGLRPEYAWVAECDGELLGLAGFKTPQGAFTGGISWASLRQHLGWPAALRAAWVFSLFERPQVPGELLMDGIVVDARRRGMGVGTQLLQAVLQHAQAQGFSSLRLDVIDANPAARRLYEIGRAHV